MTRTRTKTYFFAILTALFICGFGFNATAYEESVSSSSRLDSYSEEKIQELVNAANTHLNTLKSLAEEYQQKVRDYYSKSYSYQINEKEARRRAQNRQLWAEFLMGEDSALIKTEDERFQKLMNKTYKKNYSAFVFYMDTSSILGWASNEKKVAKANNITLTSTHLFYYTKYPVWDEVISRAQEQAAKERNPNAGAGKAIQEAQQISKLKDQIIEEQRNRAKQQRNGGDNRNQTEHTRPHGFGHFQRMCRDARVDVRHVEVDNHIHHNNEARADGVAELRDKALNRGAETCQARAGLPLHIIKAVADHRKRTNVNRAQRDAGNDEKRHTKPEAFITQEPDNHACSRAQKRRENDDLLIVEFAE